MNTNYTKENFSRCTHCNIPIFKYRELCEMEGDMIGLWVAPYPSNSPPVNHLVAEELNLFNVTTVEDDKPYVKKQFDTIVSNIKTTLIDKIRILVNDNLLLNDNIDVIKLKIEKLIDLLKQNLITADKSGIADKIDDIITQQDIDKIIQDAVTGQFIIYAFAEQNIVKSDIDDISNLWDSYSRELEANEKLQKQYKKLVDNNAMLTEKLSETNKLLKSVQDKLKDTIEKSKVKIEKGVKDVFDWLKKKK